MEKSRAIELLEHLAWDRDIDRNPYGDALNMAIEALKAQLSQEGATSDLISRMETVEHLRRVLDATVPITDYDEGHVDGVEFGISTVSTMPTIQPVATDTNVGNNSEIPNSSDAISRQWLLDCINDGWIKFDTDKDANRFIHLVRDIAPSIQPERKKGEWLPDNNNAYEMRFVCSCCKESEVVPTIGFTKYKPLWDFCPNCGADMRGEKDG